MDENQQIKQSLNIVDVVGAYIELKKAGQNYKGVCPFHTENTPSFMVSPELQIFKCFGCGEAGDIFDFVQKIEGIDFYSAKQQLAIKAGVTLTKKSYDPSAKAKTQIFAINEDTTNFYAHLLTKHPAGKPALEYLEKKRKLTKTILAEFKLGFAPNAPHLLKDFLLKSGHSLQNLEAAGVTKGQYDKFRNRIIFPLIDITGKTVGFTARALTPDQQPKYLNTPETLVFHKSAYIYGLDKAKVEIKKNGAVFVEGQMDVLSAHQAGIKNVVAASGTALTLNQLKILQRYTTDLTLCFDSDTAGTTASLRAIELGETLDFNIKIAVIPDTVTDLDELIHTNLPEAKSVLANAIPIYDFFIVSALKKHDKKTAVGKKKIMQDVAPKFSKIQNAAVLGHYTKMLSTELELKEESILDMIKNADHAGFDRHFEDTQQTLLSQQTSPQEHMLSLLFKADLDTAQKFTYKLAQKDFPDEQLLAIFTEFKVYITGRKKKFEIKYFSSKLTEDQQQIATDLYLRDLGIAEEGETAIEKELVAIFNRLKRATMTRELTELEEKLKQAELAKDTAQIKELSEKVYKISKQKTQYD